jgi:hypothetical protein
VTDFDSIALIAHGLRHLCGIGPAHAGASDPLIDARRRIVP